MPIIRSHNGQLVRFEIELGYSDLPDSVIHCFIAYGSFAPEFFIDTNSPAVKALVEGQDQRLFEILTDLNRESERLLQEKLEKEKLELAENERTREIRIPLRPSRPGYVYLVKADKYFKIGRSKQPDVRFSQIGLQLPFPFEVLHIVPVSDMYEAEKHLHSKFAHRHLNGEWFSLSDTEVAEIMNLERL
jgi:hypothetical protein